MSIDSVEKVETVTGEVADDVKFSFASAVNEAGRSVLVWTISGADEATGNPFTVRVELTPREVHEHVKPMTEWAMRALLLDVFGGVAPDDRAPVADALAALDAAEDKLPELPDEDGCPE